jgi:ribosomal protein L44E
MFKKSNKKEFLKKLFQRFPERKGADFSKFEYINNRTKSTVICQKGHKFEIRPNDLLSGYWCFYCANLKRAEKRKSNKEEFLEKLFNKFPERKCADFSKFEYINAKTKSTVICQNEHKFKVTPNSLLSGSWCPVCAQKKRADILKKSQEQFIKEAEGIHGKDRYDYSRVNYINNHTHVEIECLQCKKFFKQTPLMHLQGQGCPYCAEYGFDKSKPAILYYLKVTYQDKTYYKIGITNRTIRERFSVEDLQKIEVLKTWKYKKGEDAYKREQEILNKFDEFRYKGNEQILESGNTELFIKDVLGLDVDG